MLRHRFGRKIKLPSTVGIKHQILNLMLEDHRNAQVLNTTEIQRIDADDVSVEAEYHRQSALTSALSS
jgi:hypothetical protein